MELGKWEQTLHGSPWRMTKGVAPCAVKVACTVLNGGDEETYRKATRLVPTQRMSPSVPSGSNCFRRRRAQRRRGCAWSFSPWAGVWACSWSRSSTGWSRPTGWRLGPRPPGITRGLPRGPVFPRDGWPDAGRDRPRADLRQRRAQGASACPWGGGSVGEVGRWGVGDAGASPAPACGIARRQPACTRRRADGIATRQAHARRALARTGTSAIMPAHHTD